MNLKVCAASFIGARRTNQDNLLLEKLKKPEILGKSFIQDPIVITSETDETLLFSVADGMGGSEDGDKTALCLIEELYKAYDAGEFSRELSSGFWNNINQKCCDVAQFSGSTLVAACLMQNNDRIIVTFYSLGDSLIYLKRNEETAFKRINRLDNEAQRFEDEGIRLTDFSVKRAKATLNEYFGKIYADINPFIHIYEFELQQGDRIILASDGIEHLSLEELSEDYQKKQYNHNDALAIASDASYNAEEYCDNITVITIEFI